MFGDLVTGLSDESGRKACSTALDGTGERATPLGLADARRGQPSTELPAGGCSCSIGYVLRCVLGTDGPRGATSFRSVTGVSEGVIIDKVFAPVLGNKWFP